jgi:hypothetical protein
MNKGNKTKYGKSKQHQTKEPNTALENGNVYWGSFEKLSSRRVLIFGSRVHLVHLWVIPQGDQHSPCW